MSMFLVLLCSLGMAFGGDDSPPSGISSSTTRQRGNNNVIPVPIWTEKTNNVDNVNNNVIAVSIWTDVPSRPVPIPVFRDPQPSQQQQLLQQDVNVPIWRDSPAQSQQPQQSSPQPPQQQLQQDINVPIWRDTPSQAVNMPVLRDFPENNQAYSPPLTNQQPQAYSPPLTNQQPQAYSPPLTNQQPQAYSPPLTNQQPQAYSPPRTNQRPSNAPPYTPSYPLPVPITREAAPAYGIPPTPLPTAPAYSIPIWTDPVSSPTPIIVPVPIWTDPRPGSPSPLNPGLVPSRVVDPASPTPAFFPFPDPPTNRGNVGSPTNSGNSGVIGVPTNSGWNPTNSRPTPRQVAPTFAAGPRPAPTNRGTNPLSPTHPPTWAERQPVPPTRARRTRAPTQASAIPIIRPEVHTVSPAAVCTTVRRNLKVTGSGFLSSPTNFSCEVIPSCNDNMLWADENGNVCEDYNGFECTPDALANCRRSCRVECPRVACQDRDEFFQQCSSLRDQGRCVTDPNRMMLQCPVTCNFCNLFPAFVLSDTELACQAPPLGGQGSVTLQVWSMGDGRSTLNDPVGAFRIQSYDCQNNETSDPPAVQPKDLAAFVARPVAASFGPNDTFVSMQFYIENIGMLDLTGPVILYTQSGLVAPSRRLLQAQAQWCAPSLAMGIIVSCTVNRSISPEEQAAQALITSVWAQASFQGSVVNSSVYTFQTSATTPQPTAATTPFINGQDVRGATSLPSKCHWTEGASCWPWWAWLILALLLLLLLACCIYCLCLCKRNRETTKKTSTSYVYRRPRPQASPPVARSTQSSPSAPTTQEVAHGPVVEDDREARVAYHTMGQEPQENLNGTGPAVRLLFNTGSGPFEVRGPEPEGPSHFVFEERGSANSLSHSPTVGRRSISSYSQPRRDTRDHVVFNEAT